MLPAPQVTGRGPWASQGGTGPCEEIPRPKATALLQGSVWLWEASLLRQLCARGELEEAGMLVIGQQPKGQSCSCWRSLCLMAVAKIPHVAHRKGQGLCVGLQTHSLQRQISWGAGPVHVAGASVQRCACTQGHKQCVSWGVSARWVQSTQVCRVQG